MKDYKTVEILRPFERNGAFPIDKTSVFFDYDAAVRYAHDDQSAYPGQIVSVIDDVHKKTAIYKLDYDKDEKYRLVLQPIAVGAATVSGGGGGFNLLGVVPTRADLPDVKDTGDMYLVTDESTFYIAIETEEDQVEWQTLNLQVDLVTEVRDGIFKHEIYTTLINRSTKGGVYYSSGDGIPENNKWIEVESTSVEQERGNFTMLSIGRVKQIVSTMTNTSKPHVEIISTTPRDNYILTEIVPELKIVYYPELGGALKRITIYQNTEDVIVLDTYPEDQDLTYNEDTRGYEYTFVANSIYAEDRCTYTFKAKIEYEQSDDGNMPAGSCENTIQFNFYRAVRYGTNLGTETAFMLDGDNIIELEYHPENYQQILNTINLYLPLSHYLNRVTFVNQNDLFARSLFTGPQTLGEEQLYSYNVPIGFKSPGKFIFYISENAPLAEQ